jgi:hypothetical protein
LPGVHRRALSSAAQVDHIGEGLSAKLGDFAVVNAKTLRALKEAISELEAQLGWLETPEGQKMADAARQIYDMRGLHARLAKIVAELEATANGSKG